jgi:hypothetical protein
MHGFEVSKFALVQNRMFITVLLVEEKQYGYFQQQNVIAHTADKSMAAKLEASQ